MHKVEDLTTLRTSSTGTTLKTSKTSSRTSSRTSLVYSMISSGSIRSSVIHDLRQQFISSSTIRSSFATPSITSLLLPWEMAFKTSEPEHDSLLPDGAGCRADRCAGCGDGCGGTVVYWCVYRVQGYGRDHHPPPQPSTLTAVNTHRR